MRSTVRAAATWWVPGLSAVLVLLVLWQSRALRPIQDDYDMALYALEGPIGGTYLRWSDWSGDVWTNLINVVFVGLPLVHLPLWAGSLVPFALTAGTAVLLVLVISIPRFPALRRWKLVIGLLPVLTIAWWGWWWINAETSWHPYAESDALTTTFWQNVSATYIIAPLSLLAAWLFLNDSLDKMRRDYLAWFGIVGIGIGLTGLVFASASVVTLALVAGSVVMGGSRYLSRQRGYAWLVSAVGTGFGIVLSLLSPGSRGRSQGFPVPELTAQSFQSQLWWMADTVNSWLLGIISPASLVVTCFVAGTSLLLGLVMPSFFRRRLAQIAFALIVLSFVTAVINSAVEFVVYKGYWHLHASRAMTWVAIVLMGIVAAAWVNDKLSSRVRKAPVIFVTSVLFIVIAASNFAMSERILLRLPTWETGPAPVMGIGDIENPFVRPLAQRFWEEIGGPPRGLDQDEVTTDP